MKPFTYVGQKTAILKCDRVLTVDGACKIILAASFWTFSNWVMSLEDDGDQATSQ